MDAWDAKAEFWDELMGEEGNLFHRTLVGPATERLLELRPGQRVLDAACGTGVLARRLHALGARVLGVDGSEAMLHQARQWGPAGIAYRRVDLRDAAALAALGRFDAVVCGMALMDLSDPDPLLQAIPGLLHPEGRLVATLCHPCFNFSGARRFLEDEDRQGEMVHTTGVRVAGYLQPRTEPGVGAPGEPAPHLYHHRPLHDLLGRCFAAGLVLDGLEEPAFTEATAAPLPLSWLHIRDIPPVLALRLRVR